MANYSVTAASVLASASAQVGTGVAGATITAGQPIYKDVASDTYKLCDADVLAAGVKCDGISLNAASLNQPLDFVIRDDSFTPGFTLAAGAVVIVSATAGSLCPVADAVSGMYVSVLMVGIGGNLAKVQLLSAGVPIP